MTANWDRIFDTTVDWWLQHGSRILVILIGAWLAKRGLRALVALMNRQIAVRPDSLSGDIKQARTATAVIEHTGTAIVVFIALLMIAAEMGFNPTAILASAGIVGVALGFGAQSLVKDLLAGCFILFENQFGVGDVIRTGAHIGEVEVLSLRTTCLRDIEGTYTIIPNGDLGRITVLSKGWARSVVEVDLADGTDIDEAMTMILELGKSLADERPDWILETPEMVGVQRISDIGYTLRLMAKTAPLKQWDVSRELNKRIKRALQAKGLPQPVPKRQILTAGTPDAQLRPDPFTG